MSIYDQGKPGHGYVECRWAILVSRPSGRKLRDFIPMTMDDGVTPLTFATEAEARAAATGPQHGPFMARIEDPWRIAMVYEPYPPLWRDEPEVRVKPARQTGSDGAQGSSAVARQTGTDVPHDLMTVHDNLVPMILAQCRDLASTPNPVMFTFIDTCAAQGLTSLRDVPTDVAHALWTEGLPALRDIGDAALDPARQLNAVSHLGLERGFCPKLAVLVYQYWLVHEVVDEQLHNSRSYEPHIGVPHMLQVELRAHGLTPVIAEWKVLYRGERACVVPMSPQHFVAPEDPSSLTTAAAVGPSPQAPTAPVRRRPNTAEEVLASMELSTFVVRSPPLCDFDRGATAVYLSDSRHVTFRPGNSVAVIEQIPYFGFVTLQVVNGRVEPTFYGTDSETCEIYVNKGPTMVVYVGKLPAFKIVVVPPLAVVPSRQ